MFLVIHGKEKCRERLEHSLRGRLYSFASNGKHNSATFRLTEFLNADKALWLFDEYFDSGKCNMMIEKSDPWNDINE